MKLNIKNNSNKNSGFVCGMTRKIAELVLLAFGISLIVFCYLFDLSGWRSEIAIFLIPPALVMTDYLRKILMGSIYSWFKVWETGIKIFLSSSVMIYFFGVIGGWQSDASSVLLIASFMALILFTIFFRYILKLSIGNTCYEIKFAGDISKLMKILYVVGLKLERNKGNIYYFHINKWAILNYEYIIKDHGNYCVVLADTILKDELISTDSSEKFCILDN